VATKKQQRRRYKRAVAHTRLDGQEADEQSASEDRSSGRAAGKGRAQKPVMLGAKEVKPPSYLRAARRALIMSAFLFVVIQLIDLGGGSKPTPMQAALQAAVFFCWLTPFGYFHGHVPVPSRPQAAGVSLQVVSLPWAPMGRTVTWWRGRDPKTRS
jgi:hypothetical protein